MKLTDKQCKNAESRKKPYKMTDGAGLYLQVTPKGSKYWRFKYYMHGREKLLAFGVYPFVTLAEAREERMKAKKMLQAGKDPSQERKKEQRRSLKESKNTFRVVALEWHDIQKSKWSEKHANNVLRRLEMDIFPYIGNRPIKDIDTPELLASVIKRVEDRGSYDVASRVKQICGQIFRYGIVTGKCENDLTACLKGMLKTRRVQHFKTLDIAEMPEFLSALEKNEARLFLRTYRAMKLLMLTFVRTSELIKATWGEFDLEQGVWKIEAERMKMKRPHIVPLSRQAVVLLREQYKETGRINTPFVFPSQKDPPARSTSKL